MDLMHQLKELEKEAKMAKYYKERYEDLRNELVSTIDRMNSLLGQKLPGMGIRTKRTTLIAKIGEVVENLYVDMKTNEKELQTKHIESKLAREGMSVHATNTTKIRNLLLKEPGIESRKIGITKIIYYNGKKLSEEDKKRQRELLQKYGGIVTELNDETKLGKVNIMT